MKILLVLSIIAIFILHSCENDDISSVHYLDNKLIEGTWGGRYMVDSVVYVFKGNEASWKYYAKISHLDTLKLSSQLNLGEYLITDSSIIFPKCQTENLDYELYPENDSISIKAGYQFLFGLGLKRLD